MSSSRALNKALQLLARRDHAREELRRKLLSRGFNLPDVEAALGRLQELGYLNDVELARRVALRLSERRGWGRRRLGWYLRQHGFPEEALEAALRGLAPEEELARRALARRFRSPLYGREEQRAAAFLQRQGFDWSVIRRLLWDEGGGDPT